MKRILSIFLTILTLTTQGQDVKALLETAQVFVAKEDYANAKLVLNRAIQLQPNNYAILQELAYIHYLSGDMTESMEVINRIVESNDADEKTFQIAGMIHKAGGFLKDCERIYKKGLKKFPNSGVLHYEFGEVLLLQRVPGDAIRVWEDGVEKDPAYPGNYFHAAKYYYFSKSNPIASILYGEIFINMESYTVRTAEMKTILLESYKQFFAGSVTYDDKKANPFQKAVAETLWKQREVVGMGINTDILAMVRTRFVLEWFNKYAVEFPHKLFDQMQTMARDGLFDAYNQWLFGVATNVVQYQHWVNANPKKSSEFARFQKNRIFRMPSGQNYR